MLPTGVIPTLDLNHPVLTNRSDQMIYLLKFLMYNPGYVSSWMDDDLMSMRKSMAKYTEDPDRLVPALQQYLSSAVQRFYGDYSCVIDTIPDEGNPDNYTMVIHIRDNLGNDVVTLDKVRKDDSNLFIYKGV